MTMIQDFKKNISNLSGQSNILCYGSENIGSVSTLPGWRVCGLSVFFGSTFSNLVSLRK